MNLSDIFAAHSPRVVQADPFAGMTEKEIDAIARGEPLPDEPCRDRDVCEGYARENRDGLLLDALVNDSRAMACLVRRDMTQLNIEWNRVFGDVVSTVVEKMR